jgi:hypothetical protein
MYAKFIPIFAVESFVLFSFTGDYLNLEMFKIFYLLENDSTAKIGMNFAYIAINVILTANPIFNYV